jgi:hypothetical protein
MFTQILKKKKTEQEQPKKVENVKTQNNNNSNKKPTNKFLKVANKVIQSKKAFSINQKFVKKNSEKKSETFNMPTKFLKTNPETRPLTKKVPRLQKSKSQTKIHNKKKIKITENAFLTNKFEKLKKKLGISNLYINQKEAKQTNFQKQLKLVIKIQNLIEQQHQK